jgi:diguanylate cyclase (GGDEF)-like protein
LNIVTHAHMKKIKYIAISLVFVFIPIIILLYNYAINYQLIISKVAINTIKMVGKVYYIILDNLILAWLSNLTLIFIILMLGLFYLNHLFLIRQLRKIREAVNKFYQGEFGYTISLRGKGELGRVAIDINRMSQKLKEISENQLSNLNNLKRENLFHSQVLQMILSLQRNSFPNKELNYFISNFLSIVFPKDSCALLLQTDQEKLEIVAVWGNEQQGEINITPYECQALWEGQIHCGPTCNSRFRCRYEDDTSQKCICIPIKEYGLLRVVSDDDEDQLVTKKKWSSLVAEHLGAILLGFKMDEDLRNRSLRDPLTGLFNRRFMEEALTLELSKAARQNKAVGVIMLDLDHFKRFNDTYGHLVGDALLKEMGLLLMKHCRSSDIVCRYGGEEFTIIMPEADEKNIVKRIEQLQIKVRELRIWHIYYWLASPTISAGIAIYPYHGDNPEALLKSADHALYRAKKMGRNLICVAGKDQGQEMDPNDLLPKQYGKGCRIIPVNAVLRG